MFPSKIPGETSRRIHGVPQAAAGDAATNHRVFRTPVSGQILRRGANPGRVKREATRGCDQLQLSVSSRVRSFLCKRGLQFRVRRRHQTALRSLPAR